MSRNKAWVSISAVYGFVWLAFSGLGFPIGKDESHFWPTALLFSRQWIPGSALLRDYPDLSTPLPFLLWGWLEHSFHGGISAGRHLNLVLSLAMALFIASGPAGLCAAGLLLFPYYLGTSVYLYTDIIASFFILAGVALHLRGRFGLGALASILAVCSRQSAAAFPAAMLAFELYRARAGGKRPAAAYLGPLLAASSLLGWFLFFGDLAPASELRTRNAFFGFPPAVDPRHGLFFLSVVGLYFVVPELALLGRARRVWSRFSRLELCAAGALLSAFIVFPPLVNQGPLPAFGYTDLGFRGLLGDWPRMACYYLLAAAAVLRLLREPLALSLIAANALILCKAHVAWEKYAVPALAVLWYLRSRDILGGAAHEVSI